MVEIDRLLGLDEVLEVVDCVDQGGLDGKRVARCLSVNKAEKGDEVVGHGVAKHGEKTKRRRGK